MTSRLCVFRFPSSKWKDELVQIYTFKHNKQSFQH